MAPLWALSLAYWLHMLATVIWIGGLAALVILVIPASRKAFEGRSYASFLSGVQQRLNPLAWACLVVLAGTGMFQMSANPNYQGFLSIDNRWATAILVKHLLFLAMTGVSAYLTWGVLPGLHRIALKQAVGQETPEAERLEKLEANLLRLNLLLGGLVLALTALARVS
jgi:uncharacterized membrane protein